MSNISSQKAEWFTQEKFWIEFAPIMFDSQHWQEAPTIADHLSALTNGAQHKTLLDAGCGPGRISVECARAGFLVTGVDLITPYLEAAKESLQAENLSAKFIQADLRNFTKPNYFDIAINLYTSFGYGKTINDDFLMIKNSFISLKKGGIFVLEGLSREIAARDFIEGEWFERSGKYVLTDFSVVQNWEGLRSHWILIDKKTGKRYEHEFVQHLYSGVEMQKLILKAGFSQCTLYGDFTKTPYDNNARTMVCVAVK